MPVKKTTKVIKPKAEKKPKAPKTPVAVKVPYVQATHVNNAAFSDTRPGLLAWLYRTLYFAAPQRGGTGFTKAELLAMAMNVTAFVERYETPEIAAAKMKVTISAQVPSQFKIERGYIVKTMTRESDGANVYYLDSFESEKFIASLPDSDNRTKRPLPWAIESEDSTLKSRVIGSESK